MDNHIENNKYTMDINISVNARDSVEANEKITGMLLKLELLLGLTNDKKCDAIYEGNSILNFNIKKL